MFYAKEIRICKSVKCSCPNKEHSLTIGKKVCDDLYQYFIFHIKLNFILVLDQYGNRPFKSHDRVCQRHFKEDDINSYWETMIKGVIHRTPRDKAKLMDCAIPTQNLLGNEKKKNDKTTKIQQIDSKASKERLAEQLVEAIKKPSKKRKTDDNEVIKIEASDIIAEHEEHFEITVGNSIQVADRDGLITPIEVQSSPNDSNEMDSPEAIRILTEEDKNEMIENLDILYDEVFDTTLPSQLWGIQRCPERTFIVFSEFNKTKMKSTKLLYIDNEFQYKLYIDDKETLVKSLEKQEINTEFFSNLLNEIDENRIP